MNKQYLDSHRYNWTKDLRKLKVNVEGYMMIPDGRCFCCGRIFLNAEINIAYCRDCDKAMSTNPLGSDHDFDTWGNKIKIKDPAMSDLPKQQQIPRTIILTARREVRAPIDFDKEHEYFDRNNKSGGDDRPHFVTAAGKIVPTEPEEDPHDALYDMR